MGHTLYPPAPKPGAKTGSTGGKKKNVGKVGLNMSSATSRAKFGLAPEPLGE